MNGGTVVSIGGSTAASRNLISGNGAQGINIQSNAPSNVTIQGNYIGVNLGGTAALPNAIGIRVSGSSNRNIVVGGFAAGTGNLISGTPTGVSIAGGSTGITAQDTLIRT